MIIEDIQYKPLKIKLNGTFKVAFTEIDYAENVLIKIQTDDGVIGYGEAAPMPFVTGETAQSVEAALDLLKPGLIGLNPLALDKIHEIIDGAILSNTSAKCAIDMALYDIAGKAFGKPVYELLGGSSGKVQNDATIGIAAPEEMADKALYYVEELGYNILKIKVGIDPKSDIEALKLIRKAIGPDIRLRVDANQGYTTSVAVGVLDSMEQLGVEAIEQCLPAWDFEGSAYVRSKAKGIAIMLDESIHGPKDVMKAVKIGAADILNIKLMKCGGLYPGAQIAAIAQAAGLTCMVGCMLETRLALTAGLSLVAAKHVVTEADCDAFMYYNEAQTGVTGGFTIEKDIFTLSNEPGFGVDVDF